MGKKKGTRSFVTPTQLLVDAFEAVKLDESKKSMLDTISSMIEDEVRNQMIEYVSCIDEEITRVRTHFLDLRLMIPSKIRELTVGEIVSSGGSFELQDNDDNLVVNVPTEIFGDPLVADSLASSLMIINSAKKAPRPVLNDATNSVRRTGLRSTVKRSRIPTGMTPSSMKRGKNTSIGNGSSFIAPSTARVTRSTARKVVQSKAYTKPSTVLQPVPTTSSTFATPKNGREVATYQLSVVNNVTINNIAQNGGSEIASCIVNPKTPGGNNLFRKLPRSPKPEEDMNIVVYSNQGTPLVVDPVEAIKRKQQQHQGMIKSITNK